MTYGDPPSPGAASADRRRRSFTGRGAMNKGRCASGPSGPAGKNVVKIGKYIGNKCVEVYPIVEISVYIYIYGMYVCVCVCVIYIYIYIYICVCMYVYL